MELSWARRHVRAVIRGGLGPVGVRQPVHPPGRTAGSICPAVPCSAPPRRAFRRAFRLSDPAGQSGRRQARSLACRTMSEPLEASGDGAAGATAVACACGCWRAPRPTSGRGGRCRCGHRVTGDRQGGRRPCGARLHPVGRSVGTPVRERRRLRRLGSSTLGEELGCPASEATRDSHGSIFCRKLRRSSACSSSCSRIPSNMRRVVGSLSPSQLMTSV